MATFPTIIALFVLAFAALASAYKGDLTYYGGAGVGGACSQTWKPPGHTTVAINSKQWADGARCGDCVYACFTRKTNGRNKRRCFSAIIDNLCPECKHGDLDLGESNGGRWPLTWKFQACRTGSIRMKAQGSNNWYAKIKAEGGSSAVKSMTCGGMKGKRTDDGYFVFNKKSGGICKKGLKCTMTYGIGGKKTKFISGKSIC